MLQQKLNKTLIKQRLDRLSNSNKWTKKYEKTKKGFLMRVYRNMLSRTKGLVKPQIYKGLEILSKEEFYEWTLTNTNFNDLFSTWEQESYNKKLTPSINRIDSSRGYSLDNIEWITHSENSRLGAESRHINGR